MNDQMNHEEVFKRVYVDKWKLEYSPNFLKPGQHRIKITNPKRVKDFECYFLDDVGMEIFRPAIRKIRIGEL